MNLSIPESTYQQAALDISNLLGGSVAPADIETILKAYTDVAISGKITSDYPAATVTDQYSIASVVQQQASGIFSSVNLNDVLNDLNAMATLAVQGTLDQEIAYPIKWQNQLNAAISTASAPNPNAPNWLNQGIQVFFQFVADSINSALKGLGVSLSVTQIIFIVLGIMLLPSLIPLFKTMAQ